MVKTAMVAGTSTSYLSQEQSWFGRSLDAVSVFGGHDGWSDWKTSLDSFSGIFGGSGKDILWSVPLIPTGSSLASAADGNYDSQYRALAQQFVDNAGNDSQIYIRLGWEFNGTNFFPWSAVGKAQDYIDAYRNFVDAFRSVSDKFRFEWCPNKGDVGMNPEDAYPGDAYVDVIGMDFYWDAQQSWSFTDPVKAWNYFVTEKYGLQWHQDFAAAHNKPTAYAEWGINTNNGRAFVDLADKWFADHNVLYHNYWNSDSHFEGKLSDNQYPDSGSAFKSEFGTDTATGAVVVPYHVTFRGTSGDDSYTITHVGDVIIESGSAGTDAVHTAMNYTLPTNVEDLFLTGTGDLKGTGNASANEIVGTVGDNVLTGLGGDDWLIGGSGNDTLTGGTGVDKMEGGDGDDLYLVDSGGDQIVEWYAGGAGGTDKVQASASYTLPGNVEALTLTGTSNLTGNGNDAGNVLTGNSGSNLLQGYNGNDSLSGEAGSDTLQGGSGNDTLDGGSGVDTMAGGDGDDLYVAGGGDVITEYYDDGVDTVLASANYTLPSNVENMTMTGPYNVNGYGNTLGNVITGNGSANTIYGYDGNDSLVGGVGNDFLNGGNGADTMTGGTGADTMTGGNGNDLYTVDSTGDSVREYYSSGAGGIDTVQSSISYTLGSEVEKLQLSGTGNISGTGNASSNAITGNDSANTLSGRDGNDTLNGGDGADTLSGGNGYDVFVFKAGEAGGDLISDFDGNGGYSGDSIVLQGFGTDAYATIGTHTLTIHYDQGLETISLGTSTITGSDFALS